MKDCGHKCVFVLAAATTTTATHTLASTPTLAAICCCLKTTCKYAASGKFCRPPQERVFALVIDSWAPAAIAPIVRASTPDAQAATSSAAAMNRPAVAAMIAHPTQTTASGRRPVLGSGNVGPSNRPSSSVSSSSMSHKRKVDVPPSGTRLSSLSAQTLKLVYINKAVHKAFLKD